MDTKCRWLIIPALLAGMGSFLLAQEPVVERTTGKVLLLKNGNVAEGDIVKVGTQMCIRHGTSEIWIDADKTAQLCADWDAAYSYMHARLKLATAQDRLQFARWCDRYHLKNRALEQGKLAVQLDPDYREARLFVAMLERTLKDAPAPSIIPGALPSKVAPPAPQVDVTTETFANFAARVQPILMNKCVSCHAGGSFQLDRVTTSGQQAAIRNNMNAVLAYLDVEKPAQSPVLIKSIEAHGGATAAPFKDRREVPVQILQAWIECTIAANPRLKEMHAAKKPAKGSDEAKTATPPPPSSGGPLVVSRSLPRIEIGAEPKAPSSVVSVPSGAKQSQAELDYLQAMARKQPLPSAVQKIAASVYHQIEHGKADPTSSSEAPRLALTTAPIDPFDPAPFNQANHPHGPSWLTPGRSSASASR